MFIIRTTLAYDFALLLFRPLYGWTAANTSCKKIV